jgi:hypothetical protein
MRKRRMVVYFLIGIALGFLTGMIAPPKEWKTEEPEVEAEAKGA